MLLWVWPSASSRPGPTFIVLRVSSQAASSTPPARIGRELERLRGGLLRIECTLGKGRPFGGGLGAARAGSSEGLASL